MIDSEPNLNNFEASHLDKNENTVFFTVGNIYSKGAKYFDTK